MIAVARGPQMAAAPFPPLRFAETTGREAMAQAGILPSATGQITVAAGMGGQLPAAARGCHVTRLSAACRRSSPTR